MDLLETLPEWDPSTVFRVVDVLGVIANGFLGGMVARAMRFDIVGFLVLGVLSGLGGGMIRDVLLQIGFPIALTDPLYLTGALVASFIAYWVPLRGRFTNSVLTGADLLALGCWSATGAQKALGAGLGPLPAVLLGVVTAVGGGMVRDVVIGRTPRIFGGSPPDATLATIGALIATVAMSLQHPGIGMGLSIVVVAAIGVLVRKLKWVLPFAPEWEFTLPRPQKPREGRRVAAPSHSAHAGQEAAAGATTGPPRRKGSGLPRNASFLRPPRITRRRAEGTDDAPKE